MSDFNAEHQKMAAAVATLESMKYTWNGSVHWRPPLGKKPDFDLLDQKQAEIDELKAKVERLLGPNNAGIYTRWVSVDEGLPRETRRCLACFGGVVSEALFRKSDNAFFVDGCNDGEPRPATHWMYLPLPPSQEND